MDRSNASILSHIWPFTVTIMQEGDQWCTDISLSARAFIARVRKRLTISFEITASSFSIDNRYISRRTTEATALLTISLRCASLISYRNRWYMILWSEIKDLSPMSSSSTLAGSVWKRRLSTMSNKLEIKSNYLATKDLKLSAVSFFKPILTGRRLSETSTTLSTSWAMLVDSETRSP